MWNILVLRLCIISYMYLKVLLEVLLSFILTRFLVAIFLLVYYFNVFLMNIINFLKCMGKINKKWYIHLNKIQFVLFINIFNVNISCL